MKIFGRYWGIKPNVVKDITNAYNRAVYSMIGGQAANYDYDRETYLRKGYGQNPDVYAIIQQQADKLNSIPYYVKNVKDKTARNNLKQLSRATKGNYSIPQLQRKAKLETKAFEEEFLPFPLESPNPNQTWTSIFALSKVFEQTTGEYYLYMVRPDNGANAGVPQQMYILPSHLMKIVIKEDAEMLVDENVIDYYMLIEGDQFITFDTDDVIHVKLDNPFFDFQGSHLYGLSPLRAALRNIESSNDAIDQNVKTMKNSGAFGFIHSKDGQYPLEAGQATQLKEKMKEMDRNPERLSNIAGSSVPLAFTRISLTTDELKPFDFLSYDQKTIANVLGWSDKLLNNDAGAKYDNLKVSQRNVIINHIIPRLSLLEEALNKQFIPLFKGYENAEVNWDWSELPEMQENVGEMITAYSEAPVTPNELRELLKLDRLEIDGMDTVYISAGKRKVEDSGLQDWEIESAFKE